MIPCGDYLKHDGGVSFQISEQHSRKLFTFRGSTQEIQPSCKSGGATFTATWEWGTPTFRLQPDGVTLIEDGVHEFRLQQHPAPTTASTEQLCAFRDMGYLVMHTAVDDARIRAALLCDDVQAVVRRVCERQEVGAWVEGCSQAAAVLRLADPVWPTVRALLGDDVPLPTQAQVAVKAPGGVAASPGALPPDAHIDGLHAPGNGVPAGELHNFTLLVGVSLTDTPAPNMGNLGVFPGSHRAVARAVGRAGAPAAVATLSSADAAAGGATARLSRLVGDLRGLAPPQPLCVLAGAATLAHYQLVHYVQPNALGVTPRVAVYFRVTAPRRGGAARTCPEALTPCGLFSEMPGLARLPD